MARLAEIYRLHRKTEDYDMLFVVLDASHDPIEHIDWNEFGGEDPRSFFGIGEEY